MRLKLPCLLFGYETLDRKHRAVSKVKCLGKISEISGIIFSVANFYRFLEVARKYMVKLALSEVLFFKIF